MWKKTKYLILLTHVIHLQFQHIIVLPKIKHKKKIWILFIYYLLSKQIYYILIIISRDYVKPDKYCTKWRGSWLINNDLLVYIRRGLGSSIRSQQVYIDRLLKLFVILLKWPYFLKGKITKMITFTLWRINKKFHNYLVGVWIHNII